MGKHAKGGWSQKRFQSLVEEDVKHHADKVRTALAPMIEKNRDLQWVIAGGEGKLVKMILEGYDYPVIMKSMDMFSNSDQMLKDVMSLRLYGI
jgi:6-phosphogluconate dehydrogenase